MTGQKSRLIRDFAACLFAQRWIRFGAVGFAATLSYFLLGLLFVNLIKLPLLVGNGLAYIISFAVSYAGQSRWTFQSHGRDRAALPRFAAAQALGLCLNSCIIGIGSRIGLKYELSMAVAIVLVPVFVYLLCKYWVFRVGGK